MPALLLAATAPANLPMFSPQTVSKPLSFFTFLCGVFADVLADNQDCKGEHDRKPYDNCY